MSVVYLGFPVGAKTGFMLAGPPKEVVMTVGTAPCNVFDADLPTLSYSPDETPAEVYPRFQAAQQQAPVAIGPLGPEVLSYHLVRSVLRDNRFQIPPGIVRQAQGVTSSGPLWDNHSLSLRRRHWAPERSSLRHRLSPSRAAGSKATRTAPGSHNTTAHCRTLGATD
jgi:hypothetical protein